MSTISRFKSKTYWIKSKRLFNFKDKTRIQTLMVNSMNFKRIKCTNKREKRRRKEEKENYTTSITVTEYTHARTHAHICVYTFVPQFLYKIQMELHIENISGYFINIMMPFRTDIAFIKLININRLHFINAMPATESITFIK